VKATENCQAACFQLKAAGCGLDYVGTSVALVKAKATANHRANEGRPEVCGSWLAAFSWERAAWQFSVAVKKVSRSCTRFTHHSKPQ
jgi:glutamate/tyrosine decarboxylase-like PLP-dependent enzyme